MKATGDLGDNDDNYGALLENDFQEKEFSRDYFQNKEFSCIDLASIKADQDQKTNSIDWLPLTGDYHQDSFCSLDFRFQRRKRLLSMLDRLIGNISNVQKNLLSEI